MASRYAGRDWGRTWNFSGVQLLREIICRSVSDARKHCGRGRINRIQHAVEEAIRDEVSSQLTLIKFNIGRVFGGLLYSLKLELEKQDGKVSGLDDLIRIVVDTTHRAGPEDESYPGYDEAAVAGILKRLEGALQAHGIEQAWNIGKKAKKAKSLHLGPYFGKTARKT